MKFPISLDKLGIRNWDDLIFYFPNRYIDESKTIKIRELSTTKLMQVQVEVENAKIVFRPKRNLLVTVYDDSGYIKLRFLHFRQSFEEFFKIGRKIRVLGIPKKIKGEFEFIHPKIKDRWLEEDKKSSFFLTPYYSVAKGIEQTFIRRWVEKSLTLNCPEEWIPQKFLKKYNLPTLKESIKHLHCPKINKNSDIEITSLENKKNKFWKRIKMDELLAQQIALRSMKKLSKSKKAPVLSDSNGLANKLLNGLPFELTTSQRKVWNEVKNDLLKTIPSHRLIQGDVGSGKTVIAGLAVAATIGSGRQAAVMAPSELLANQLFQKLYEWLIPLKVNLLLLLGGQTLSLKKQNLEKISNGEVDLVVGTHALIQDGVDFNNLGLSLIDEQHRFGVTQRASLRKLGSHVLGMSATPIPRSLAMTYLADIDISTIDELPKNRKQVITKIVSTNRRDEILERIRVFVDNGGQAFWVCPMIDDPKDVNRALSTLKETEMFLKKVFNEKLAVVHSKLSPVEKNSAMEKFLKGEVKILLATTVIEVGIDIPNAGLIIIENAERFGLAQLHQLRGRVGRGSQEAACILLYDEKLSDLARERLKILYSTHDGFELAKKDLGLRGPGEIIGIKQSGEPELKFCNLSEDWELVNDAVYLTNDLFAFFKITKIEEIDQKYQNNLSILLRRWSRNLSFLQGS